MLDCLEGARFPFLTAFESAASRILILHGSLRRTIERAGFLEIKSKY